MRIARTIITFASVAALAGCLSSGNNSATSSTSGNAASSPATAAPSGDVALAPGSPTAPSSGSAPSGSSPSVPTGPSSGGTTIQPVGTTADDIVPAYAGAFGYGSNMGYYNWADNDKQLASLLVGGADGQSGVGVRTVRPALFDKYVQYWGIDSRKAEFAHYKRLGAIDLTLFFNQWYEVERGCKAGARFSFDSGAANRWRCQRTADNAFDDSYEYDRRDAKSYGGCNQRSWLHANMYKPIWVGTGASRTVNADNYLAKYVADIVSNYKEYGIKFYEVWNEPDYTENWQVAQEPTHADYWEKKNPKPCDLSRVNAPISHHVRLHRVVYEVVKATDPTALVATGGLGYWSYLDALMRNTDNPGTEFEQNVGEGVGANEGTVDAARYPKKGGAYFDVLSFHTYPQYALTRWIGSAACNPGERKATERCYNEHSDAAVNEILVLRDKFNTVMSRYGYGSTLPAKHWIVTETNVPRLPARAPEGSALSATIQYWGAEDYARNFLLKAMVVSQKQGIRQTYLYQPSDEYNEDGTECDGRMGPIGTQYHALQGMFKNLKCVTPNTTQPTVQAHAMKTISSLLYGWTYDAARTQALAMPAGVDGGAFKASDGRYRYVLWAKTAADRNENSTATYSIPASVLTGNLKRYAWDHSRSGTTSTVAATGIALHGAPAIFEAQ